MRDLRPRELWAVGPLIALVLVLGVYPKPALDLINPAVQQTLTQVHSTNPVPPHPGTTGTTGTTAARTPGSRTAAGTAAARPARARPARAGTTASALAQRSTP